MKLAVKFLISFFVGLSLVFVGIMMGGLDVAQSFDLSSIQITNSNTKEYNYSFEDVYGGIELDITNAKVNFYRHGDDDVKVKISNTNEHSSAHMSGDYVVIKQEYDLFNNQATIDIGIPNGHRFDEMNIHSSIYCEINDLRIDEINIEHEFGQCVLNNINANDLMIKSQVSLLELNNITCNNDLTLDVTASQVTLYSLQEYNYDLDIILSQVQLFNQSFSGNENTFIDHHVDSELNIKSIISNIELRGGK